RALELAREVMSIRKFGQRIVMGQFIQSTLRSSALRQFPMQRCLAIRDSLHQRIESCGERSDFVVTSTRCAKIVTLLVEHAPQQRADRAQRSEQAAVCASEHKICRYQRDRRDEGGLDSEPGEV